MSYTNVSTIEEFKNQVYTTDKLILIYFWADWCGPCKALGPVFQNVSENIENVNFIKINIDQAKDIVQEFQVQSIPALYLVRDKNIVSRANGYIEKKDLINWIERTK